MSESSGAKRKELQIRRENDVMTVNLDAYNAVIAKTRSSVTSEEKKLNEKLEELWTASLNFLDEMNQFHEQRGVGSPWWNAVKLSTQNPGITNAGSTRRQRQRELEQMKTEVNQLEKLVESGRKEINELKGKIAADEAKLLELKRIDDELQQEPFGSEFLGIKAKIQRSKETCLQLGALLVARGTSVLGPDSTGLEATQGSYTSMGNLKRQQQDLEETAAAENPGFIKASNFPDHGIPTAAQFTARKVFKMRERTTLVYRRQAPVPATAHLMKNFASDFGHTVTELNPWESYDPEDNEEEITHS